jgi:isopentenyl diphosphate isomerase/L-lactate dehydrogenase-like FMN-dependent dehydrogenase
LPLIRTALIGWYRHHLRLTRLGLYSRDLDLTETNLSANLSFPTIWSSMRIEELFFIKEKKKKRKLGRQKGVNESTF